MKLETLLNAKTPDPRLYITLEQFDRLDKEYQLDFLYCPECKRFHNADLIGRVCGCKLNKVG